MYIPHAKTEHSKKLGTVTAITDFPLPQKSEPCYREIVRPAALLLALLPALPAATFQSRASTPVLSLRVTKESGAQNAFLSVSCTGYTFVGDSRPGGTVGPATITSSTDVEFQNANPACTGQPSSPLPGTTNSYVGTYAETNIPRYTRATFRAIWTGVDLTYEVSGNTFRLIYELDSPLRAPSIALRLSPAKICFDGILCFGPNSRASVRVLEVTPDGHRPTPYTLLPTDPVPFRLPATTNNNPIRIILESSFEGRTLSPPTLSTPANPRGEYYEATANTIAKYDRHGNLLFETTIASAGIRLLLPAPDGTVYALGNSTDPALPVTPGAAQSQYRGAYFFLRLLQGGDITVSRIDGETGRLLYATYLGGRLADIASTAVLDATGNLHFFAGSNSPDFPTKGTPYPNACVPQPPPNGLQSGRYCSFAVTLTPEGGLLSSQALPLTYGATTLGPNAAIYALRNNNIEVFTGPDTPATIIPLATRLTVSSLTVDSKLGLWLTTREGLFHLPPSARAPRRVMEVPFPAVLLPIPNGGVLLASYDPYSNRATGPTYGPTALMPKPCPQGSPEMIALDTNGNIEYATFLPSTSYSRLTAVNPPSGAMPPEWQGRTLAWGPHRLDVDAPPTVAIACLSSPSGDEPAGIAPGALIRLAVRGVQDEAPVKSLLVPGQPIPTRLRDWSIEFDGIPAGIIELNQETLTLTVPQSLQPNRTVMMSFAYRGRRESSLPVQVAATAPVILQQEKVGNELRLQVTGVGPANPPMPDNIVPATDDATPLLPPDVKALTGQSLPIIRFRQIPGQPPGVYELRLQLP